MNRRDRRAVRQSEQHNQNVDPRVTDLIATAIRYARSGQAETAITCFRRAVKMAPKLPTAHYNLGNALAEHGEPKEAIFYFRKAIALAPNFAEAHSSLAAGLTQLERLPEARTSALKAVEIAPASALANFNLGAVLEAQRRLDEAALYYQKAVQLQPDFAVAHLNLAMIYLAKGDFENGWKAYEWRWKTPQMIGQFRPYGQPQWQGQPAEGKTLLIHAEQGFGDTIQFCRYARFAAAKGLGVIMQVQSPLVRLLENRIGVDHVIAEGEELPAFDFHCPLMSLPLALGIGAASTSCAAPYLSVDGTARETWRDRIAKTLPNGLRVGLVWAGNARKGIPGAAAVDKRRSVKLEQLTPLLEIPGVTFFSLQKDHSPEQQFQMIDLMSTVEDFADTAALIANLDLVISVDTAVAHLAAALGKDVWLLNRQDSCWRWTAGRSDTLWYPSMRIYNQTQRNEWKPVVARIAADLEQLTHTWPS